MTTLTDTATAVSTLLGQTFTASDMSKRSDLLTLGLLAIAASVGGSGGSTDITPITDRLGDVSSSPAANTALARLFDLQSKLDPWVPQYKVQADLQAVVSGATGSRSFLVPLGKTWHVMGLSFNYTCSASAGNRQIAFEMFNGSNVCPRIYSYYLQPASVGIDYQFTNGIGEQGVVAGRIQIAIPEFIAPAGFQLRIWDMNAIAPTTDVISNVVLLVGER